MTNDKEWVDYSDITNKSDSFIDPKKLDSNLSDSFETLSGMTSVRGKSLPLERYTAGDTNNPDQLSSIDETSTLPNSRISRRYSPVKTDDYSGNRPGDPVFVNFASSSKSNELISIPTFEKPKSYEEIEQIQSIKDKNIFVRTKNIVTSTPKVSVDPMAARLAAFMGKLESEYMPQDDSEDDVLVDQDYDRIFDNEISVPKVSQSKLVTEAKDVNVSLNGNSIKSEAQEIVTKTNYYHSVKKNSPEINIDSFIHADIDGIKKKINNPVFQSQNQQTTLDIALQTLKTNPLIKQFIDNGGLDIFSNIDPNDISSLNRSTTFKAVQKTILETLEKENPKISSIKNEDGSMSYSQFLSYYAISQAILNKFLNEKIKNKTFYDSFDDFVEAIKEHFEDYEELNEFVKNADFTEYITNNYELNNNYPSYKYDYETNIENNTLINSLVIDNKFDKNILNLKEISAPVVNVINSLSAGQESNIFETLITNTEAKQFKKIIESTYETTFGETKQFNKTEVDYINNLLKSSKIIEQYGIETFKTINREDLNKILTSQIDIKSTDYKKITNIINQLVNSTTSENIINSLSTSKFDHKYLKFIELMSNTLFTNINKESIEFVNKISSKQIQNLQQLQLDVINEKLEKFSKISNTIKDFSDITLISESILSNVNVLEKVITNKSILETLVTDHSIENIVKSKSFREISEVISNTTFDKLDVKQIEYIKNLVLSISSLNINEDTLEKINQKISKTKLTSEEINSLSEVFSNITVVKDLISSVSNIKSTSLESIEEYIKTNNILKNISTEDIINKVRVINNMMNIQNLDYSTIETVTTEFNKITNMSTVVDVAKTYEKLKTLNITSQVSSIEKLANILKVSEIEDYENILKNFVTHKVITDYNTQKLYTTENTVTKLQTIEKIMDKYQSTFVSKSEIVDRITKNYNYDMGKKEYIYVESDEENITSKNFLSFLRELSYTSFAFRDLITSIVTDSSSKVITEKIKDIAPSVVVNTFYNENVQNKISKRSLIQDKLYTQIIKDLNIVREQKIVDNIIENNDIIEKFVEDKIEHTIESKSVVNEKDTNNHTTEEIFHHQEYVVDEMTWNKIYHIVDEKVKESLVSVENKTINNNVELTVIKQNIINEIVSQTNMSMNQAIKSLESKITTQTEEMFRKFLRS